MQAIQFAAQAVLSGTQDVVIASGVESMTRVPMGSNVTLHMKEGLYAKAAGIEEKFPGINFSQFMGAEMIVKKHGFTKDDLDRFALSSHEKAIAATKAGAFEREIVPVEIETPEGTAYHTVDEGIRFDATLEGIAGVKLLSPDGAITAASASQICDGSSAVLVVSEELEELFEISDRLHVMAKGRLSPALARSEAIYKDERFSDHAPITVGYEIDL